MSDNNATFVCQVSVAWGEMDALAHVNNVAYFRYFETARIAFFEKYYPLEQLYRAGCGPVISENQARYKRAVTYPDTLSISVSVSKVHSDRFTLEYEIFSDNQQAVTTTGSSVAVMFDFRQQRKADMPEDLYKLLKNIQQIEP
ncbi:acyl-CoA thioesterase [Shewanella sp. JM162201]|uniref:Acyl-CoA thioesterase n=1 Tax=Shewanella jiangmenensis TaxID=2837387 RepID=A0ABS5V6X4_9GAMM|nr:thioesterase family protein [Shewanella jiangmenensis]MBT1446182.1 acyl-CoA thioesterase [Shewanella jiangmenensis]